MIILPGSTPRSRVRFHFPYCLNSLPPASASLLDHRSFVRFWAARVAAVFAYQMQAVAVGWQIYALTGSMLDLGLVGLAQFLPSVALLLVVGHVADRYDRRRIVGFCQLIEGGAAVLLAVLSASGRINEQAIFALIAVIGAARAFEMPTQQTLLPSLVPARLLSRATSCIPGPGGLDCCARRRRSARSGRRSGSRTTHCSGAPGR